MYSFKKISPNQFPWHFRDYDFTLYTDGMLSNCFEGFEAFLTGIILTNDQIFIVCSYNGYFFFIYWKDENMKVIDCSSSLNSLSNYL